MAQGTYDRPMRDFWRYLRGLFAAGFGFAGALARAGVFVVSAAGATATAVLTQPAIGVAVALLMLLVVTVAAGYRTWQKSERARLKAETELGREEPVWDRIDRLADDGELLAKQILDVTVPVAVWRAGLSDFVERATGLLRQEAPEYLTLIDSTHGLVDPGPGLGTMPVDERKRMRLTVMNRVTRLRDFALRLRARAGEDIGRSALQLGLARDLLRKAHDRVLHLMEVEASADQIGSFRQQLQRLVDAALELKTAAWVMADTGFDMSWGQHPRMDQAGYEFLGKREIRLIEAQTVLTADHLRPEFDAREWANEI